MSRTRINIASTLGVVFSSSRMLIGATSTLFLLSRGLSLAELTYLKGLQAAILLLLDLPFGRWADRSGRQSCVRWGIFCSACWMGLTAYSPHTIWLYLGECFNGLSLALFNGAYEALLVDAQPAAGHGHTARILGRNSSYNFCGMALAAYVGSSVTIDSTRFWWIGCGILLGLWGLLHGINLEAERPANTERITVAGRGRSPRTLLYELFSAVRRDTALLWAFTAMSVCLGLYFQYLIQFWQPLARLAAPNQLHARWYGWIFLAILLCQAAAGWIATRHWLRTDHTGRVAVGLLLNCLFLQYTVRTASPWLIPALITSFLLIRLLSLQINTRIHAHLRPDNRATYLSFISTATRLLLLCTTPLVAWWLQRTGLASFPGIGIACTLVVSGIFLVKKWNTQKGYVPV